MQRQIVCFQIPAFPIALARLNEPSLRQRPVAVASPHTPRACLQDVSLEARREGLEPGMPVEDASRLCRSLRLLPPDPSLVRAAQRDLLHVVSSFAPVWEQIRPGQLFLDLSGTTRLFGPAIDAAARLEREVAQRQGLIGMAGVASNKLVSRVAVTQLEPPEVRDIRLGEEQHFLSPVPVSVLSELNPSDARMILPLLEDLNLPTLGAVAEVPLPQLELVFGPRAARLHQWARGIDASPVLPSRYQPHLEATALVEPDEVDDHRLLGLLYGLVEQLCGELRARRRVCGRLSLSLLSSDRQETTRHQQLPPTQWESEVYPMLRQLFFRTFTRRVRVRSLRLRTDSLPCPAEQLALFGQDDTIKLRMQRLALALDQVRSRFGSAAVQMGRTWRAVNREIFSAGLERR